jgi:hypothetical protein
MTEKNITERVTKLESKVEQHDLDLIGLHQVKHKHASWITTTLNRIGVMEIQVKAHDRVVWASLFAVIGTLATIAGFLIVKYVLPPMGN